MLTALLYHIFFSPLDNAIRDGMESLVVQGGVNVVSLSRVPMAILARIGHFSRMLCVLDLGWFEELFTRFRRFR